ncbi:hypothetical protein D9M68_898080 [compost metagenome]
MVHVEINDGHALEAVALQLVFRGHRHVVHEAEAHGLVACGVVTRRAHGAEGVGQFTGHHGVGGVDGGARREQDRIPGVDVDGRVRVHLRVGRAAGRDLVAQPVGQATQRRQVHAAMGQFHVGQ